MELRDVIYEGPGLDDSTLLTHLPIQYRDILEQVNGFVQLYGGLHIRGICSEPLWHSLHEVWHGQHALSELYNSIKPTDIPFGQDAAGDQFILRNDIVHRLRAETDELESLACDFLTFLERAQDDPVNYLRLQPMLRFYNQGNHLEPGQLINIYPPFCSKEAANGVSLRAIPALERLRFLADFARQVATAPDGQPVRIKTTRSRSSEQE